MKIQNIGVMSPGDMGQAVAQQFKQEGYNVYTALDKRSARTKALAQRARLTDVGSIEKLTETCEVILSIMSPAAALDFAGEVAQALSVNQHKLLFADCNAIAPGTMHAINAKITAAGGSCVDACILEPPPRGSARIWIYLSGSEAHELEQLRTPQISTHVLSKKIGDASAFKMCLCAVNKGRVTMMLEVLIAARLLGVDVAVEAKLKERHGAFYDEFIAALPKTPPKAQRLMGEMLEVAQTFESVGMTPRIFEGAADMFELVAATKLGKETPENRDRSRGGEDIVRLLADERR